MKAKADTVVPLSEIPTFKKMFTGLPSDEDFRAWHADMLEKGLYDELEQAVKERNRIIRHDRLVNSLSALNHDIQAYNGLSNDDLVAKRIALQKIYNKIQSIANAYPAELITLDPALRKYLQKDFFEQFQAQFRALQVPSMLGIATRDFNEPLVESTVEDLQEQSSDAQAFAELLANMSPDKVAKLLGCLAPADDFDAEAVESLYGDEVSSEAEAYRLFWENAEIEFLGGDNSLNFKVIPTNGAAPFVLKAENLLDIPKGLSEGLRKEASLQGTFAAVYAEREVSIDTGDKTITRTLQVTEFFPHGSVRDYSKKIGRNDGKRLQSAASFFSQMAGILSAMSVHQGFFPDMKLRNWLVDSQGKVRIADSKSLNLFNVAGIYDKKNHHKAFGSLTDTEQYSPPEFDDKAPFSVEQAYAYMLGKTLYQYLTNCNSDYLLDKHNGADFDFQAPIFQTELGKEYQKLIEGAVKPVPGERLSYQEVCFRLETLACKALLENYKNVITAPMRDKYLKLIREKSSVAEMTTLKKDMERTFERLACKLLLKEISLGFKDEKMKQFCQEKLAKIKDANTSIEDMRKIRQELQELRDDPIMAAVRELLSEQTQAQVHSKGKGKATDLALVIAEIPVEQRGKILDAGFPGADSVQEAMAVYQRPGKSGDSAFSVVQRAAFGVSLKEIPEITVPRASANEYRVWHQQLEKLSDPSARKALIKKINAYDSRKANDHFLLKLLVINQAIEDYNQLTGDKTAKLRALQDIYNSVQTVIRSVSTETIACNPELKHYLEIDLFKNFQAQFKALGVSSMLHVATQDFEGPPAVPKPELSSTERFAELLANMAPEKVAKLTEMLSSPTKFKAKFVKELYKDEISPEASAYRSFWKNATIEFLGGGHSLSYKIIPANGDKPFVLKAENLMSTPKSIGDYLRSQTTLKDTFAPVYAERQTLQVTDFYPHGSLRDYSEKMGKKDADRLQSAVSMFSQMGSVLTQLKTHHGFFPDMRLRNWLVDDQHKLRLVDIKSLKLLHNNDSYNRDLDGLMIFSIPSSPPEILNHTAEWSQRFDVSRAYSYMFGKNLYQYLTNCSSSDLEKAYTGENFDFSAAIFQTDLGQAFRALIIKTVKIRPEVRPSFDEVVLDMEKITALDLLCRYKKFINTNQYPDWLQRINTADSANIDGVKKDLDLLLAKPRCLQLLDDIKKQGFTKDDGVLKAFCREKFKQIGEATDVETLNAIRIELQAIHDDPVTAAVRTEIVLQAKTWWGKSKANAIASAMAKMAVEDRGKIMDRNVKPPGVEAVHQALERTKSPESSLTRLQEAAKIKQTLTQMKTAADSPNIEGIPDEPTSSI